MRGRRTPARDLSARNVSQWLGQTTGFLYHHWGSFDRFLLEVSGLGWKHLVTRLSAAYDAKSDPTAIVFAYVEFAWEYPVLYALLAERPLAPTLVKKLRSEGLPSLAAWQSFGALLARAVPDTTPARARAMYASAHGLASQMLSGRLSSTPDTVKREPLEVAREVAVEIARAYFPDAPKGRARPRRRAR